MKTHQRDCKNEAARRFIEPIQEEVALSTAFEAEFKRRIEEGDYVGAVVIAIYFS